MKRLLQIPKIQLLIGLLLIIVSAFFFKFSLQAIVSVVLSIFLTVLIDLVFVKIRGVKFFFPSAALVTGCIIGLLFAPNLPLYELALVALLANVSKHFIKVGSRHIFNPAAFGMFVTSAVFGHNVSWWGVSFQGIMLFLLLSIVPLYVSVIKMRRLNAIVSFIVFYIVLNYFLTRLFPQFDPTVLFFAFVMLAEPMTSPGKAKIQIIFGAVIAILSVGIATPTITTLLPFLNSLPDPLITSLLLGNLIFFKLR